MKLRECEATVLDVVSKVARVEMDLDIIVAGCRATIDVIPLAPTLFRCLDSDVILNFHFNCCPFLESCFLLQIPQACTERTSWYFEVWYSFSNKNNVNKTIEAQYCLEFRII